MLLLVKGNTTIVWGALSSVIACSRGSVALI